MSVSNLVTCRDCQGNFGIVRQYQSGRLMVSFDYGIVWADPSDLIF